MSAMTMRLNPYINFKNTAREAMEFYQDVLGGELTVSTFADFGADVQPDEASLVMHAQLESPDGLVIMASDTPSHMDYKPGTNFSISIDGDDEAQITGYWSKLTAGGQITMPLESAAWGGKFGMVIDKFGIGWLVSVNE
jgi:PhnB protein